MVFMMNAHGFLALLGLIIGVVIFLFFILRTDGDKERRITGLSTKQQRNEAETDENVFEMLKLVRNRLEASKITLKNITPQNKIGMTKNLGLLSRVESSAVKNDLVKSSDFVMGADIAKDSAVQKTGIPDEEMESNILEYKIAKVTENILSLNDALKRLLEAKEYVRIEAPTIAADDASGLSPFRQYLPFFLGDKFYAAGMATVQEVLQATRLVDPGTPEKVRSAINLDGSVVPVIDLSTYFGGEMTKVGPNTLIVILLLSVDDQLQNVGIKVDGVGKIIMVNQASVVPTCDKATSGRNYFAQGEFKTEHHSITLLDFNQGLALNHILRSHFPHESLPSSLSKKYNVSELPY